MLHVAWAGLAHRARHTLGRRHRRGRVHLSIDGQCTRVDRRLLCRLIRSTPTRISNTTNPNSLMTHSGALWCAGCTASHDGLSTDVCTAPFDRRMQTVHAGRAAVDAVGVCIVRFGQVVDHQRLSGSGYVYSASLPPFNAVASICALEMVAPPTQRGRTQSGASERSPTTTATSASANPFRLCALSRLSCQMKTGEAKHATLHANSRAIHAALQALVSAPIDALNPRPQTPARALSLCAVIERRDQAYCRSTPAVWHKATRRPKQRHSAQVLPVRPARARKICRCRRKSSRHTSNLSAKRHRRSTTFDWQCVLVLAIDLFAVAQANRSPAVRTATALTFVHHPRIRTYMNS